MKWEFNEKSHVRILRRENVNIYQWSDHLTKKSHSILAEAISQYFFFGSKWERVREKEIFKYTSISFFLLCFFISSMMKKLVHICAVITRREKKSFFFFGCEKESEKFFSLTTFYSSFLPHIFQVGTVERQNTATLIKWVMH